MNKFSKGPWSRNKYGSIVDSDGNAISFRSVSILCSGSAERTAEAEANTDLATAAPDLLKALKAAYVYIGKQNINVEDGFVDGRPGKICSDDLSAVVRLIGEMSSAIGKAEGDK